MVGWVLARAYSRLLQIITWLNSDFEIVGSRIVELTQSVLFGLKSAEMREQKMCSMEGLRSVKVVSREDLRPTLGATVAFTVVTLCNCDLGHSVLAVAAHLTLSG